jgi:hypothetical protein
MPRTLAGAARASLQRCRGERLTDASGSPMADDDVAAVKAAAGERVRGDTAARATMACWEEPLP